jgi:DNA-binding NtrC family response regulator
MTRPKVLLVDDNDQFREMMQVLLQVRNFEVVSASSVTEALGQIVSQAFDVLITDLHMPQPGDGFAVVTAMRHAQPDALTLVVSGFPDVQESMADILLQADEILVKPFEMSELVELIRKKTEGPRRSPRPNKEGVASILERDAKLTIERWFMRVGRVEELTAIPLAEQVRTNHLPEIIENIISRLRHARGIETVALPSPAAIAHGQDRFDQGYTVPQVVEEARILQVSIFETIQRNLASVDFSLVMPDIMLIADEVDSQLKQSIDGYLTLQQQRAA